MRRIVLLSASLLYVLFSGCNDYKISKVELEYTVDKNLSTTVTFVYKDISFKSDSSEVQEKEIKKLYSMREKELIKLFLFEDNDSRIDKVLFQNKTPTNCDLIIKTKPDYIVPLLPIFHAFGKDSNFTISKKGNRFAVDINKNAIFNSGENLNYEISIKIIYTGKVLYNNANSISLENNRCVMEWDYKSMKEDGIRLEVECADK